MKTEDRARWEVNTTPTAEEIDEDGHFTFGVFVADSLIDRDVEQAVLAWANSVDEEYDNDLVIKMRLRDVFESLYELHCNIDMSVDKEDAPLFAALRKDCAWVIEQIDGLKYVEEPKEV